MSNTLAETRPRRPVPRPPPPPSRWPWVALAAIAIAAVVLVMRWPAPERARVVDARRVADAAQPPDVTALRTYLEDLELRIADVERTADRQALASARISLETARSFLRDGSTDGTCDDCKATPSYRWALARWPVLAARVAAVEQRVAHCTFGYKQPGGAITPPDVAWTDAELDAIRERSLHHQPRCWLAGDAYWP